MCLLLMEYFVLLEAQFYIARQKLTTVSEYTLPLTVTNWLPVPATHIKVAFVLFYQPYDPACCYGSLSTNTRTVLFTRNSIL